MVDLDWQEVYEIGIDFIDEEHKDILALMRDIRDAILENKLDVCSKLSNDLIVVAQNHFSHEESFLEKIKFPELEEHKIYHQELLVQANRVKELCEGKNQDHDLLDCFNAMEEFLIDDVLNGDIQFVSFLEENNYIKRRAYS